MKTIIMAALLILVGATRAYQGPLSNGWVEQTGISLNRGFAEARLKAGNSGRSLAGSHVFVGSSQPIPAQAQPEVCRWQEVVEPDKIRFPVNMDTHAAYAIYVFGATGDFGLNVTGDFPYAAFLSFTTYQENGLLFDALLDKDIIPNPGSVNPFQNGALVNAPQRSYRMMVLPYGLASPSADIKSISMPPIPTGAPLVLATLVLRVYLPAPNTDRQGGVILPIITTFSAKDMKTPLPCPRSSFSPSGGPPGSGSFNGIPQAPAPKLGKILFYRPPVSGVPFADGSGQLTKDDCTGYLMATVNQDKLSIIRFKKIPTFFDNTKTNAQTTFSETQVRYLSMGSYGASVIPVSGNIAGPAILTKDGEVTFVVIPASLPADQKARIEAIAAANKFNVLPMAKKGPEVLPFLIYRNKVAATGFEGSVGKVPCYTGAPFGTAPADYAASSGNMGPYAPQGQECAVERFLLDKCGF